VKGAAGTREFFRRKCFIRSEKIFDHAAALVNPGQEVPKVAF